MAASSPPSSASFVFNSRPSQGQNSRHLFQPPPAQTTTSTDYFSPGARKRARADSALQAPSYANRSYTPRSAHTPWTQCPTPSDGSYSSGAAVDASIFVNDRYTLAGGLDTPALRATAELDEQNMSAAWKDRRRARDEGFDTPNLSYIAPLSGPLARDRNGMARIPSFQEGSEQPESSTWTGLAFGLVGKVFHFGTNVFRGFYAGGGTGFDLKQAAPPSIWDPSLNEQATTPLPGSWQDDENFDGDFEQDNPSSASRPAYKRRQTDRDSWIMVGSPDTHDPSPRRKVSGGNVNTPRSALAVRPAASRASNRRNLAPMTRRQSSHVSYGGSPVHAAVQPLTHDSPRRASFAPTRSPHSRPSSAGVPSGASAYISPEAGRFAKRQAKQDRATDKAMTSMSRKLEDLIRQGQEALGTKISIEDDGTTDEGFVDDDMW